MGNNLIPLLDAVEVNYGPRIEVGRNILMIAERALSLGVKWYFGRGFDRLVEVNEMHMDTWSPLAPPFDPRMSEITEDNAIYIEGQHDGKPVVAMALRRYDWPTSSLGEEWEAGRFAYRDPASQMKPDEQWIARAPIASSISGRVSLSGGLWFRPDFRGRKLPVLTADLSRCVSVTEWNPDFVIGMIETGVTSRVLVPLYGNPPAQSGMMVVGGWKTIDSTVIWENREDLVARILKAVNKGEQLEATAQRIRSNR